MYVMPNWRTTKDLKSDFITVWTKCRKCEEEFPVQVKETEYNKWKCGHSIQYACKSLSPELRERLISGICPNHWDEMFPENEK